MDLFSKKGILQLFREYRIFPKKRLGQNFLIDRKVLKKILKAADLKKNDTILEIGPGIGNLTQELAKNSKRVIAVEKDQKMIEVLKETTKNLKNVIIIQRDILKISNFKFLIPNSYKIVANLPYYIVAPVIRKFLEMKNPPRLMVLMVQKEVAQRICAKPPHMSLLAVSVQFYAKPEIISYVSKKSFWPQPKVDSAILKLIPRLPSTKAELLVRGKSACSISVNQLLFFKIAKAGFSQPRKQLINNLSRAFAVDRGKIKAWLLKNKINPSQRAETLNLQDWIGLTKTFDAE